MAARISTRILTTAILLSAFTLDGCVWFNEVGESFPVVGDRCEYWQCFTEYGQQQSDLIKQQKARSKEDAANAVPYNAKPVNAPGDIPPGATGYTTPPAPAAAPVAAPAATPTVPQHHVEFLDPSKMEPITVPSSSDSSSGWLR